MRKNSMIKIIIFTFVLAAASLTFINFASTQSCPQNTTVLGDTQAILVGEVVDDGGDPNLTVWFQYGKTQSYSWETPKSSKYGTGIFCSTVSGLEACTTYHYRAVSQNSVGASYGENKTFTTKCAPTVDIKANNSDGPITVNYNTAATLSWTSTNANSCSASNGWSGSKGTFGSESTGNLTSSMTYTITCTGPGGSASDSVTVNVNNPPPTVDIKANNSDGPINIFYKESINLSWISQNSASCQASGDWSGQKSTFGSQNFQLDAVKTYVFTITCVHPTSGQTSSDSVQVIVKPKLPVVITKPAIVTL